MAITTNQDRDVTAKINEHRDDLEALADSDLACADVAKALLEVADNAE